LLVISIFNNMKFRPCIDLHSGQVKQIVGSTLKDNPSEENDLATNFATDRPAGEKNETDEKYVWCMCVLGVIA
jgi:hypothetical protein